MKDYRSVRGETIAAIVTPMGQGAVGIVRISGDRSLEIASKICRCGAEEFKNHHAHFRRFYSQGEYAFDEGIVLFMKAPNSFTGEDVVELQGHGGTTVMRRLLQACFDHGARMSLPGEFSFRAFLNGRLDLAQAEGIASLISSRSEKAAKIAEKQLQGHLSRVIALYHQELIEIAAVLEAWVDFPEEGLEFASTGEICAQIEKIIEQMQVLASTYEDGARLQEGISLCLVGRPNVGKSSLLNALLRQDRAIVTEIAGTTRDVLQEDMTLGTIPIRLIDTAGIRECDELIEKEGIRRSWQRVKEADLVLCLLDGTTGLMQEDLDILEQLPKASTLVLWNKIDICPDVIPSEIQGFGHICISAKTREGLDELSKWVQERFLHHSSVGEDELILMHLRHKEALLQAISYLQEVIEGLFSDRSAELVASDMKEALSALGAIYGGDVTEDVLTAIFSKFCIGK